MTEVVAPPQEDFLLFTQATTEIAALAGRVDVYTSERHTFTQASTEVPVESGSVLTDQAVAKRATLRLVGVTSDVLPAPGNTLSPDRATDTWNAIARLIQENVVVTVVTALRVYRDMLIGQATAQVDETTGRSLRFTLDLAEVLFTDTEIVRFAPAQVDPQGPAAGRGSLVDHGDLAAPVVAVPTDAQAEGRRLLVESGDIIVPSTAAQADVELLINQPEQPQENPFLEIVRANVPTTAEQFDGLVRAQRIPLTRDARQTFRTILGGQSVRMTVFWQPMNEGWYVSLVGLDQEPIVSGLRLAVGSTPLRGVSTPTFQGSLIVVGPGPLGRDAWAENNELIFLVAESQL